ncbi:hypothetical protein MTR_1g064310 [Medicago truncatula]|uniref:Uncharacterized protein n=1 Tax=Medicago truncatula TaxID=3880 RepID=A0A072VKR3_MEDTR|nr:hypothetical protein MTR_1g064310 [Medicago truncatula]
MGRGYPNPSGTGMGFNFSFPLGMGRVTGKYMRIGYGDGEGKTRPHPASLPCLKASLANPGASQLASSLTKTNEELSYSFIAFQSHEQAH